MTFANLSSDDKRTIWNVFKSLDDLILNPIRGYHAHIGVAEATLDSAKRDAFHHHLKHLLAMRINPSAVDPYKIAAWYGFYICKHADDEKRVSLLATINLLNNFLSKEPKGVALDKDMMTLMYRFASNDNRNDEHGIGKNGLYLAFATARRVLSLKK